MASFSRVFQDAKRIVSAWQDIGKIENVTIVRDVKGRISVYLEPVPRQNIDSSALSMLSSSLTASLGVFFSGMIYVASTEEWTKDLFRKIEQLRVAENNPSAPHWFKIERGIAKKAWIQRDQTATSAWNYDDAQQTQPDHQPGIITFYSYKGGMGRTTDLVAVALELIHQHKNVLMIDTDLEAPGLSTFFFPASDREQIQKGTVDYLLEKSIAPNARMNMADYILTLSSPNYREDSAGALYLVCGGRLDEDFLPKLARIDSQELVEGKLKSNLEQLLKDCRDALKDSGGIDYILIDSRAGFHDMAGIVTAQLPHGVVLFGKDSFQSWFGIRQAVQTIALSQKDTPLVMLIDSGCGKDGIVSDKEKEDFRAQSYNIFSDCYYSGGPLPSMQAEDEAHSPVFVPYVSVLSGDIPLYDANKAAELKEKLSATPYKNIARRLMGWFGETFKREGGIHSRE